MERQEILSRLVQLLLQPQIFEGFYNAMIEGCIDRTPNIGIHGLILLDKRIPYPKAASGFATLQLWVTVEGTFKKAVLYSPDGDAASTKIEEISSEAILGYLEEIFVWGIPQCQAAAGLRGQKELFQKLFTDLSELKSDL